MGQQAGGLALSIGGRLIGGFLGGPVGAAIGGMAGGLIGSLLFNRSQKPLIPDWQLASSSYGHPIPIIYGQIRLPATVIWETEITTKSHGIGGKGFGGGSANSYHQSAAFAFCEGVARPLKLWLDGKLFYDLTATTPHELTKYPFAIRTYTGGEAQLPDPLIQNWVFQHATPADSTPAYRGLAFLVFQEIDLAHFGNRMPNVSALWATDAAESIIVRKLNYWSDDTDVTQFMIAGNGGVSVDWVRWYAYTLSYTGIIRCFDMRTGLCINKVDAITQLGLLSVFLQANSGAGWGLPSSSMPLGALAADPGGDVYVSNIPVLDLGTFIWSQTYIWRLDSGLTNTVSQVLLPKYSLPNNFVKDMACFDLVGPLGSFPMLVGRWLVGPAFLMDPNFGFYAILPTANYGLFGRQFYVIGKQDQIAGTVDVWILNGATLGSDQIYIYKAFVVGTDVSAIVETGNFTQVAILSPADFGITPTPSGYASSGVVAAYDASDDTLILSDFFLDRTIKWSPDTGVVWINSAYTLNPNSTQNNVTIDAGRYGNGFTDATSTIWVNDSFSGTQQSIYSETQIGIGHTVDVSYGYESGSDALVFSTTERNATQLYIAFLQRFTGSKVRVADIIADLCERVGMTSDMFDVSQVTDLTWGYLVADQKSAGMAVLDLCHTFQIDMVESDYVLKFIPRGQAPIATITQQDLASVNAQDAGQFWEAKRAQEQELPLQINVRYNDPELDFQAGSSYAKRIALPVPTTFSKRVKTIDLPVVADNIDARHIAERWLYTLWAERDTFHSKLGWKYLFLDPTDNVTVNLDNGDSYTLRIESTDVGADFAMDVHLASEDVSTYVLSTSPGALVSFTPQTLAPAAFVDLLQFNVPLLQDSDDLGGLQSRIYYAAAAGAMVAASSSTTLYQSSDANAWAAFQQSTAFANWGRASSALPDTPAKFATDYLNSVIITMSSGSTAPASCSYTDMMNGANAALLGQEIIQFQTATTNADGSITLSMIVRGRRGTEWATGLHKEGEIFILLAVGEVTGTRLPLTEIGVNEFYKLVPINAVLSAVPTDVFAYNGSDLKPYAPCDFKRTPQHSPIDLVLTWKRRTRIGGWMVDGSDTAPLNESTEAYEAYVLANSSSIDSFDPTNAATYVRKFSGLASATTTYTASEMATDGFDPSADTLYLAVYQLSAVIGRGFRGYEALPAF